MAACILGARHQCALLRTLLLHALMGSGGKAGTTSIFSAPCQGAQIDGEFCGLKEVQEDAKCPDSEKWAEEASRMRSRWWNAHSHASCPGRVSGRIRLPHVLCLGHCPPHRHPYPHRSKAGPSHAFSRPICFFGFCNPLSDPHA
jgi:hypothetical protein